MKTKRIITIILILGMLLADTVFVSGKTIEKILV